MPYIEERKRKDGATRYRVQVRIKGYPVQMATFGRKTDAKRWATQVESEIRQGRYFKKTEAEKHTVGELLDRYRRDILPHKARLTIKQQGPQAEWWKKRIGHVRLSDISPALIRQHLDAIASETSPSNANRYHALLSHAFSVAGREWEWIEPASNPFLRLSRFKEPRGRIRFLSDDERQRLLEVCREHPVRALYPVVLSALSTGCRKNEILSLRWRSVDLEKGWIRLEDSKNKQPRAVPLRGPALDAVREWDKVRRIDTDLVFPSDHDPKEPIKIDRAFVQARDEAGIEGFVFHDLRHSCASYLAMSGASLAEIAEVLGHRTLAMVKRYAHLSEAHTSRVVEKMTAAFLEPNAERESNVSRP